MQVQALVFILAARCAQHNNHGKTDEAANQQRQTVGKWCTGDGPVAGISPIEKPNDAKHDTRTLDS